MRFNNYCQVCGKLKGANVDHSACRPKLADAAKKNSKPYKAGCRSAQKYMEHLRSCGALD